MISGEHYILCFELVWMVLAVVIRVPCCRQSWALPMLLCHYRTRASCEKEGYLFKKKTELARERLALLAS